MKKEKKVLKVEDVENNENTLILDVPDYVYVSNNGKFYYPAPTKRATIKRSLEEADAHGIKPSKAYQIFVDKLAKEQKEKKSV